jgi:hypothetical protein
MLDESQIADTSVVDGEKPVSHYQYRFGPTASAVTALREWILQKLACMRGPPNAVQVIQDHSICGLKKRKSRRLLEFIVRILARD